MIFEIETLCTYYSLIGHISNTNLEQTKCSSCDLVIGIKVCREVIPPKLIVLVPKPDNRKHKPASSPLDDQTQRQIKMIKGTQNIDFSVDKLKQINDKREKKNSFATSKPFCTQPELGVSVFTNPSERNISKKVTEISHKENNIVGLLPKTDNEASDILPWQKVSQKQEYRKSDADFSSMVSNDSKYPTEVEKWAVHSHRLSKDGINPLGNEQTSLHRFQQPSLAGALNRPEMKYVQHKTASTAQKIQNDINNPAYVSDLKSSFLGGNQELAKKVYDSKELFFKENQGAGLVGRNLWERHEEASGEPHTTKSSKSLRCPIDLDVQFDLAKEREAQVAVMSKGKENRRNEPETEKPSKPDVYQPRGLRRRECPKGLIRLNL